MERELHLEVKLIDEARAELCLYFDNPNEYRSRELRLDALAELARVVGLYYGSGPSTVQPTVEQRARDLAGHVASRYTLSSDLAEIGQWLYRWLDGSERLLGQALGQCRGAALLILAIRTDSGLACLPWELLHDGESFLVNRGGPAIVPVRWRPAVSEPEEPVNRPLQLLFMATSPLDTAPVLDYEGEEAQILRATRRQPLTLTVEESGSLEELRNLVGWYGAGYFDVFHLTGHAGRNGSGPYFLTESETGEAVAATPQDLERALIHRPRLIFLSGCRTAEGGDAGSVSSMADALLDLGAPAVLGWVRPVHDGQASRAAAVLYEALAMGLSPANALSRTYQTMIEEQASDWHLLQLYLSCRRLPGGLVTPLKERGRLRARQLPHAATQDFVGRRRSLQRCLRALRDEIDTVGVMLTGLRGVGKSSLAHRLQERLQGHQTFIWHGRIDEHRLVNLLADDLPADDLPRPLRTLLRDPDEKLKLKLRAVLKQLEEPLLFIFDDFEANAERRAGDLELREGLPVLFREGADVVEALIWAIETSGSPSRILVASRFDFSSDLFRRFHHEPLSALSGADLEKKVDRLLERHSEAEPSREMAATAAAISDGNPRLLEWLFDVLSTGGLEAQVLNERLAATQADFREHVLAQEFLVRQSPELRQALALSLVFELPVPRAAIATIAGGLKGDLDRELDRAVALGLLEVSGDPERYHRVPRILESLLTAPADPEGLSRQAVRALVEVWPPAGPNTTDEQRLEIHRLALAGQEGSLAQAAADALSESWFEHSRFQEVLAVCAATTCLVQSHRLLYRQGSVEIELGETERGLGHLRQALALCPADKHEEKRQILETLAYRLGDQGALREALEVCQEALALAGDRKDRNKAETLHQLGCLLRDLGEASQSLESFHAAIRIFQTLGEAAGLAATTADMAHSVLFPLGKIDEALGQLRGVLQVFEQREDLLSQAAVLHDMADIYQHTGQPERAFDYCERSLLLSRRTGSVRGQASTLRIKANVLQAQGKTEQAETFYEEALALAERVHNTSTKAITLYDFARFLLKKSEVAQAREFLGIALGLDRQSGRVSGQIAVLFTLAQIETEEDRSDAALELYRQALDIASHAGAPLQEVAALDAMADLEEQRQASDSALELHERSLMAKHRIEDRQGAVDSLFQVARLKAKLGRDSEALSAFSQALEIATSLEDAERQVSCLQMMAVLQEKTGLLVDAFSLQLRALALYERLQEESGQSRALFRLAQLAAGLDEVEGALDFYRCALAIEERIGGEGQAVLQRCLGDLLAKTGRGVEAAVAYRAALAFHERSENLPGQGLLLRRLVALERREGRPEAAAPLADRLRSLVAQGTVAAVEVIQLSLGNQLIPLADPQQGGTMLPLITRAREELARERGIPLAPVRIQDSDRLAPREYEIVCDEEPVLLREAPTDPTPEIIVLDLCHEFLAYQERLLGNAGVPSPNGNAPLRSSPSVR